MLAICLAVGGCGVMPSPPPPPQPLLLGDRGVIVQVINDSSDPVEVYGLDGVGALKLEGCDELRWVIPEGQAIVDVRTPDRRMTVPIDVDAGSEKDLRVYIDRAGVIRLPTLEDPGAIDTACARGGGAPAQRATPPPDQLPQ